MTSVEIFHNFINDTTDECFINEFACISDSDIKHLNFKQLASNFEIDITYMPDEEILDIWRYERKQYFKALKKEIKDD